MASKVFQALLGRAIERARCKSGLSTPELSERTGVDPLHISLIEEGKAAAQPFELVYIANALSTSVENLCPDFRNIASHFEDRTSIIAQVRTLKVRSLASRPQRLSEGKGPVAY